MRAWLIGVVLLLVAATRPGPAVLAADQALTADQAKTLETVRNAALAYTQQLPDFICTQVTHRRISDVAPTNPLAGVTGVGAGGGPVTVTNSNQNVGRNLNDLIEERLTYFHQQESYEVISVNGRKAPGVQHMDVGGAISMGEFGSVLHDIFDEQSRATFTWERMEKVRGKRAYVFGFRVPKENGMLVIHQPSGRQIVAAYKGKILIDESSMDVLRIFLSAEIPPDFPLHENERTVDYESTDIAGKRYMLPSRSEVRMTDDARLYLNTIEFKNYEKFAVESTIHYNN